jgi:predicted RND superfamily exporter protein
MFILLFRNISLALIAIVPNIFSAAFILGIMGWVGIPLDMMTITIAAITIGISVDDTIHYIHRLQKEFPVDRNYKEAINRCHGGIGKAMYYTSVAIIFGFGLLSFSNFIPTIYFGLLTGFAMLVALAGDLLLLPAIVLITKPRIY